jgi:hypothetical protein
MAPSTDSVFWRRGPNSLCCAAQSNILLKDPKINPTLAGGGSSLFVAQFTPKQEIRRRHGLTRDRSIFRSGWFEGSPAMSEWPLAQQILNLEGFDFAAFLLSAMVAFFSIGFAVDYIFGRQGMGPYWNSLYAMLGAYGGLCAHDWWLRPYAIYDPFLMIGLVVGGLLATVLTMTAIAQR